MSRSHFLITEANTLILGICRRSTLELYKMQHPKSLTLCWYSIDAVLTLFWCSVDALLTLCWRPFWGVAVSIHTIFSIETSYTSIMSKCCSTAVGLYKMHHTRSLTLCWCSFSDWGCDHVMISWAQNGCQYVDSGYMLQQSTWILYNATPKIIDTLLTLCWCCVEAPLTLCWCSVDALLILCWCSFWGVAVLTLYSHTPMYGLIGRYISRYSCKRGCPYCRVV